MIKWQKEFINLLNQEEDREKVAFFVGSGISFDPFANLSTWYNMIETAMNLICSSDAEDLINEIISRSKSFMPEKLLDIISGVIGTSKTIEILNIFQSDKFNINHAFLACLIINYNLPVLTTNYDELIELAAKDLYDQDITNITYVDNDGFNEWFSLKHKSGALIKLHGTLNNKRSIRAVIRQIAKGTSEEMENILNEIFENYHVCFWGYSLLDKFDIVPILLEKVESKKIIVIKFEDKSFKINSNEKNFAKFLESEETKLEESITSLMKGGFSPKEREQIQEEAQTHQSNVNYLKLIQKSKHSEVINYSHSFPLYCVGQFLKEKKHEKTQKGLEKWVNGITRWDKLLIIAEIFFNLREEKGSLKKIIDICNTTISILQNENCGIVEKWIHAYLLKGWAHRLIGEKCLFYLECSSNIEEILNKSKIKKINKRIKKKVIKENQVIFSENSSINKTRNYWQIKEEGLIYKIQKEKNKISFSIDHNLLALEDFEQAEKMLKSIDTLDERTKKRKGYLMHQKGVLYQRLKNYKKAMKYLNKAVEIREDLEDIKDITYTEFQKFLVRQGRGEFNEKFPSDYLEKLKTHLKQAEEKLYERGLIEDKTTFKHNRAYIYQTIGDKYSETEDYNQAEELISKSIALYNEVSKERRSTFNIGGLAMAELRLAQTNTNLAHILYKTEKFNRAKMYVKEAKDKIKSAIDKYSDMGDSYRIKQVLNQEKLIKELEKKINKKTPYL